MAAAYLCDCSELSTHSGVSYTYTTVCGLFTVSLSAHCLSECTCTVPGGYSALAPCCA